MDAKEKNSQCQFCFSYIFNASSHIMFSWQRGRFCVLEVSIHIWDSFRHLLEALYCFIAIDLGLLTFGVQFSLYLGIPPIWNIGIFTL